MDRARRAGFTALIVVVLVAIPQGCGGPACAPACRRLAAVDARRLGGPDRRRVGVRRVRRGRQPGRRAGRPARARGRLCDVLGIDRDAQGDVDGVARPRPGQADPASRTRRASSQRVADATYSSGFAATGGAIALRVVGGAIDRCHRLGRRDERVRRGARGRRRPPDRAWSGARAARSGMATDTNDNACDWFVQAAPSPQGLAAPPVPAPAPTPSPTPTPIPTPTATPPGRRPDADPRRPPHADSDGHADRDSDAHADS